jgi:hypothetical protein
MRDLEIEDDDAEPGTGDRLTTLAREHPLLLIAGGLAVGVAISTLIPKSPTRRWGKQAFGFVAMLAELGASYGREAIGHAGDAGRSGKERLGELSDAILEGAARFRDRMLEKADD